MTFKRVLREFQGSFKGVSRQTHDKQIDRKVGVREEKLKKKTEFEPSLKCGGADLNGHDLRHKHLKLACLPIPPPPRNV